MPKSQLSLDETRALLLHVAAGMQAHKDELTQADKAIGDGDHGIGMARGFEAVQARLATGAGPSLQELFMLVGTTLLSTIGGASGAIFGTLFRGGARGLAGPDVFNSSALARFLDEGLRAVQARGKAKPGDKTMVDALAPAAHAAQAQAGQPLDVALAAAVDAARAGVEKTKSLVATMGKARTLGERSPGHPDPGAVSTFLILQLMLEYVQQEP